MTRRRCGGALASIGEGLETAPGMGCARMPAASSQSHGAALEPLFGHDLGVTPPIAIKQVRAMGSWNALAKLDQLPTIPTLVVGADQDLIARPAPVRPTAHTIAGAQLIELPDAAHGVIATEPERINPLLAQHFARAR